MTVQRSILLLGNGYVAQPCAEIVLRRPENRLTIASRNLKHSQSLAAKLGERAVATTVDVNNAAELEELIGQHDLTISLIPYTYHATVIQAAIRRKKHVVTTSYINPNMQALDEEARRAGITVMNEIGLDPGIDHLYAVKTIEEVHAAGGKILEFISYCGGLPAPECSNNPLGYKFSWSSRGVLLALRNSAKFYRDGKVAEIDGPELMKSAKPIPTGYPAFAFVGYPNRDSTPYRERYQIPEARTIIRGTLRYDGFPQFVQALVNLGLLSDEQLDFLQPSQEHQSITWRQVICRLVDCDPQTVSADQLLSKVVEKAAPQPEDRQQIIFGLKWLGLLSEEEPLYRRGTLLDTLCATLEEKMKYGSGERDMVMLQHRFLVQLASGQIQTRLSTLLDFGVPHGTTSMAKTVGVPCGLATQLILDGKLAERGVIAPMSMSICQPLLEALEAEGIRMTEEIIE